MALVTCKECGAQVAESAPACPSCGVTNPGGRTATIAISRKSQLTAAGQKVEVYLDEQLLGRAEWAKRVAFDISPGEHRLAVVATAPVGTQWVRESRFDISGAQTVEFECGNYGLKGFDLRRI